MDSDSDLDVEDSELDSDSSPKYLDAKSDTGPVKSDSDLPDSTTFCYL